MSFSPYLVHKPIYGLVQKHFGDVLEGQGYLAFAVYGVASLLGAAILHYAVEQPGLQLREWLMRRYAPPRSAQSVDTSCWSGE